MSRAVVPRQRETRTVEPHVCDAAGEVLVVEEILALVDLEPGLRLVFADRLERPLPVSWCSGWLLRPARAWIRHLLGKSTKRIKLLIGVEVRNHCSPVVQFIGWSPLMRGTRTAVGSAGFDVFGILRISGCSHRLIVAGSNRVLRRFHECGRPPMGVTSGDRWRVYDGDAAGRKNDALHEPLFQELAPAGSDFVELPRSSYHAAPALRNELGLGTVCLQPVTEPTVHPGYREPTFWACPTPAGAPTRASGASVPQSVVPLDRG